MATQTLMQEEFSLIPDGDRDFRDLDVVWERVDQGRFGVCESCGESIPPARLCAAPTSRFCLECHEEPLL
jgi:DnaK suppressor protein